MTPTSLLCPETPTTSASAVAKSEAAARLLKRRLPFPSSPAGRGLRVAGSTSRGAVAQAPSPRGWTDSSPTPTGRDCACLEASSGTATRPVVATPSDIDQTRENKLGGRGLGDVWSAVLARCRNDLQAFCSPGYRSQTNAYRYSSKHSSKMMRTRTKRSKGGLDTSS